MEEMKKGQITAQPFIIIFALIVAALILAWGIKVVFDIKERGEYAELLTTITDIREEVKTYYNFEMGSRKKITITVPEKISCFCFLNVEIQPILTHISEECQKNRELLVRIMHTSGLMYNLFITPSSAFPLTKFSLIEPTTLLKPMQNPLCIEKVNEKIIFLIENKGSHVEVQPQPI